MDLEIIAVFVLLVLSLTSFALEKVSVDVTAIALLAIILGVAGLRVSSSWPSVSEVMMVFASEAPLTIACMFVISAALNRCKIIEKVSEYLSKYCVYGITKFMLILLSLVAIFSAFMNNTPVVVVLLPVVMTLSKSLGVSSSKLLIPVSYASIFGGCCTLIGTSTNILASGIMSSSEMYPEMEAMSMFELSKIGVPLMLVSICFLIIFGRKLLPDREGLSNIISDIKRKDFLTEAVILADSPLIGKKAKSTEIRNLNGVRLLDIVREGKSMANKMNELHLAKEDKLILSCKPQGIIEARELEGLDLFNDSDLGIKKLSTQESIMVEAVIGPSSSLISKSVSDAHFRSRFNLTILAIHRKGKNLNMRMDKVRLQSSDTLLIQGTESSLNRLRSSEEVILLDQTPEIAEDVRSKAPLVLMILGLIILCATKAILPISVASLIGVSALLITGCIKPAEAYKSIEWNILMLIFGMLALGITMQKTGASSLIASLLGNMTIETIPKEWQMLVLLVGLYCITSWMTEILSNNATIVIMAPIALQIAHQIGLSTSDARAFILTTCIAASASFITPIGYQTNTFVYSVGGYKFGDFMKIGIFLNIIYCLGTIALVSTYWDFWPKSIN